MSAIGGQGTIRVLLADDQKVVREGLAVLLDLLPKVQVVGTAVDGDDAVRQALALRPDVVLMDLRMPNCDGVRATRRLTLADPPIPVVVLTTYSDDESVFAALRAGARGFLTKSAGAEEILHAICAVVAGEAQLDPSVQRRLVEVLTRGEHLDTPDVGDDAGRESESVTARLTPREIDVLVQIAHGLSNAEIAVGFGLSEATVKTHVNHLLAKTGSRDRAQLVALAFRRGLVARAGGSAGRHAQAGGSAVRSVPARAHPDGVAG